MLLLAAPTVGPPVEPKLSLSEEQFLLFCCRTLVVTSFDGFSTFPSMTVFKWLVDLIELLALLLEFLFSCKRNRKIDDNYKKTFLEVDMFDDSES